MLMFRKATIVCLFFQTSMLHPCVSFSPLFQDVWILSVCVIIGRIRPLSNQEGVFSLHLPRLRHQAHKELYAYKQVSTPSDKHTCTVQLSSWKTYLMYWIGCCSSILTKKIFSPLKITKKVFFAKCQGAPKVVSRLPAVLNQTWLSCENEVHEQPVLART